VSVGPVDRDAATAAFFDAAAAGKFLLQQCPRGHYSEPPATQCTTCGSTALAFAPASGGASLVSWAVTWAAAEPDGESGAPVVGPPVVRPPVVRPPVVRPPVVRPTVVRPTVLVIAEFDEGPWWWSQLVDADPEELAVSARLVVGFAQPEAEHEPVPVFRLAR
jgi:uncharacterized protein